MDNARESVASRAHSFASADDFRDEHDLTCSSAEFTMNSDVSSASGARRLRAAFGETSSAARNDAARRAAGLGGSAHSERRHSLAELPLPQQPVTARALNFLPIDGPGHSDVVVKAGGKGADHRALPGGRPSQVLGDQGAVVGSGIEPVKFEHEASWKTRENYGATVGEIHDSASPSADNGVTAAAKTLAELTSEAPALPVEVAGRSEGSGQTSRAQSPVDTGVVPVHVGDWEARILKGIAPDDADKSEGEFTGNEDSMAQQAADGEQSALGDNAGEDECRDLSVELGVLESGELPGGHADGETQFLEDGISAPEILRRDATQAPAGSARFGTFEDIVADPGIDASYQDEVKSENESEWSNADTEPRTPWRALRGAVPDDEEQPRTVYIADPYQESGEQLALVGNEPLANDELDVLEQFVSISQNETTGFDCKDGPAAALVLRLVDTIRFQNQELANIKEREVLLGVATVEEERRRMSFVQRRRSSVLNTMSLHMVQLEETLHRTMETDTKDRNDRTAQVADLSEKLAASDLVFEKLRKEAEKRGIPVPDSGTPEDILASISATLDQHGQYLQLAEKHGIHVSHRASPQEVLGSIEQALGRTEKLVQFARINGVSVSPRATQAELLDAVSTNLTHQHAVYADVARSKGISVPSDATPEAVVSLISKALDVATADQPAGTTTGPNQGGSLTRQSAREVQEHYAARLLSLERVVQQTEERNAVLSKDNHDLQMRLSQQARRRSSEAPADAQSPLPVALPPDSRAYMDSRETLRDLQASKASMEAKIATLGERTDHLERERNHFEESSKQLEVSLDEAKYELRMMFEARENAVLKVEALESQLSDTIKSNLKFTSDMSDAVRNALQDLQDKEKETAALRLKLAAKDAEAASTCKEFADLFEKVQQLESAALDRSRAQVEMCKQTPPGKFMREAEHTCEARSQDGPSPVSSSPRTEDHDAGTLKLLLDSAQCKNQALIKSVEGAKRDCEHWKDVARSSQESCQDLEGRLTRLSGGQRETNEATDFGAAKHADPSRGQESDERCPMMEKLTQRLESLIAERRNYDAIVERLRHTILQQRKIGDASRSELRAEISTLKAEMKMLETDYDAATTAKESAQLRLDEFCEQIRRPSMSSYAGDESRRGSVLQDLTVMTGSDGYTTRFDDPIIQEAIASVHALVGSKDDLDARNRDLNARLLQALASAQNSNGGANPAEQSILMEAAALYRDMTQAMDLQRTALQQALVIDGTQTAIVQHASGFTPERPLVRSRTTGGYSDASNLVPSSPSVVDGSQHRQSSTHASNVLHMQLQQQRDLADSRAEANARLRGMISDMELEIKIIRDKRDQAVSDCAREQSMLSAWCERISGFCGAAPTQHGIEDVLRRVVTVLHSHELNLDTLAADLAMHSRRTERLLVQKRILSHIIDIYRRKYRFDIFSASERPESRSPMKRFQTAVRRCIFVSRVQAASKPGNRLRPAILRDILTGASMNYHLIPYVNLVKAPPELPIPMASAVLAHSMLPSMQNTLTERDDEIDRLRAAIAALEPQKPILLENLAPNVDLSPARSFSTTRVETLTKQLTTTSSQVRELNARLQQETQDRQRLELRASKYALKCAEYKRRLGQMKNRADARDRTYKTAITYLRDKADRAVRNTRGDTAADLDTMDTQALLGVPLDDDATAVLDEIAAANDHRAFAAALDSAGGRA